MHLQRATLLTVSIIAAMPGSAAAATVLVDDDVFKPAAKTVRKGEAIRFRWVGESPHDVVASAKGRRIWTIGLRTKGTVTRRFSKAGTYKLICTIHAPDMRATIRVR